MTTSDADALQRPTPVTSRGYYITVDDGRDAFFALSIEEEDSDTAWLMSDTVRDLKGMR